MLLSSLLSAYAPFFAPKNCPAGLLVGFMYLSLTGPVISLIYYCPLRLSAYISLSLSLLTPLLCPQVSEPICPRYLFVFLSNPLQTCPFGIACDLSPIIPVCPHLPRLHHGLSLPLSRRNFCHLSPLWSHMVPCPPALSLLSQICPICPLCPQLAPLIPAVLGCYPFPYLRKIILSKIKLR